jgi:hypothetical protein
MVTKETSEEIKKEEAFVFSSSPFANQSCLFSPNTPSSLTSDHLVCFNATHDPLTRYIHFPVDFWDLCQAVCLQVHHLRICLWDLEGLNILGNTLS